MNIKSAQYSRNIDGIVNYIKITTHLTVSQDVGGRSQSVCSRILFISINTILPLSLISLIILPYLIVIKILY